MRKLALVFLLSAALTLLIAQQTEIQYRHLSLPTSKVLIGPAPGVIGPLNGFTSTIAVSPDKRYAAFLNDGYGTQKTQAHQSITILDLSTNELMEYPEQRLDEEAHQSYFIGLAFSSDGTHLYASIGSLTDPTGEKANDTGNGIAVYSFQVGKVSWDRLIEIAPQQIAQGKTVAYALRKTPTGTVLPYPAGLAVVAHPGEPDQLLVANNYSDNILLLNTASGDVLKKFDLSTHKLIPSEFPYTCLASRDGRRAWCDLWNTSRIVQLDLHKGAVARSVSQAPHGDATAPGAHPTAMTLSPDEKFLYVALANANTIVAIPTDGGPPIRPDISLPGFELQGTCPEGVAVSGDGSRLFVAESCINAVAVVDVSPLGQHPITGQAVPGIKTLGMIPTQWYPTAVGTVGDDLLIATSKGSGTGPNKGLGTTPWELRHKSRPYIPTLLYGSVSRLKIQDLEKQLPYFTAKVQQQNLLTASQSLIQFAKGSNPIRHIIYVIKENRTYEQVFGDLKAGNGDPSITMYGNDVTPNEHKLALQFGVLDNFYDSGEVSGDGHEWSTAAITTDYNENTWQISYRSKERTYDFQGTVADEFPLDNDEPDVDAPATGYLWDNFASHNMTYRDYGEFITTIWCKPEGVASPKQGTPSAFSAPCSRAEVKKGEALPANVGQPHGSLSAWPWPVPLMKSAKATKAALRDHFDPNYPDFNTDYPDQLRADEFLNEFEGFVRARTDGKGTELPQFVLLYLPDDHTHGTTPGHPRPTASVADNDLALGRVIEAVSHSPYWDDTAIFVLEDDAQDGADHVDAHRSIAFVISQYSPGSANQPFLEHGFYTTVNMVHTMEALLGLPPMNQNDGYAPLMDSMFSGSGNQPPFTADWGNRDNGRIYEVNPPRAEGAAQSAKMDFTRPDRANPAALNAILWRDRKGDAPMPQSNRSITRPPINRADPNGD